MGRFTICVPIYIYIYRYICLSITLSTYLSVRLFIYTSAQFVRPIAVIPFGSVIPTCHGTTVGRLPASEAAESFPVLKSLKLHDPNPERTYGAPYRSPRCRCFV